MMRTRRSDKKIHPIFLHLSSRLPPPENRLIRTARFLEMTRACSRDELAGFIRISGRRAEEIADVAETIGLKKRKTACIVQRRAAPRSCGVCGQTGTGPDAAEFVCKKTGSGPPALRVLLVKKLIRRLAPQPLFSLSPCCIPSHPRFRHP